MDEQSEPSIPVPQEPPAPEPSPPAEEASAMESQPVAEPAEATVTVTYRGQWPGKDQVTGQRWECGQQRAVPYNVAALLVKSRFFSSPAFPESLALTR